MCTDPNGPFRDPKTGYIHLFMQYCPRGRCLGQGPVPTIKPRNYQSATHFYSTDGGATWAWTGNASGVVANCDPLIDSNTVCKCKPKLKPKPCHSMTPGEACNTGNVYQDDDKFAGCYPWCRNNLANNCPCCKCQACHFCACYPVGGTVAGNTCESANDCPDDLGVYSGSTTVVNGVPYYAYPGVHHYQYGNSTDVPTMSQCFATPVDPTDKTLKTWRKQTFITQSQIPQGISQHFNDDSSIFRVQGRWWIFMGGA